MGATSDEIVSVVVITALPVEQAAVKRILDEVDREIDGFVFGTVKSEGEVTHRLAVGILPEAGNTSAAAVLSDWAGRFVNARYLVMVGIAGGIPAPEDPERHVRLGDVLVPDSAGILEHNRGKQKAGEFEALRGATPSPSSAFVAISRQLIGGAITGEFPWQDILDERYPEALWSRPGPETDVLTDPSGEPLPAAHPEPDPYRAPGVPRLVAAMITSGNVVVKDRAKRDELAGLGGSAVEMEGAGVAISAWVSEREFFAVRGVVDYSDGSKGNVWHPYGSAAAAAVLRSLLDRKSPTVDEVPTSPLAIDGVQATYLADITRSVASAIVAAETSRGPVVSVVERWQSAHDAANRNFTGWDSATGEKATVYLPRVQVDTLTGETISALDAARMVVQSETLPALTATSLLARVTENGEARKWLAALKRALEDLVAASSTWPRAASGNKFEPPPLDDGGALAAAIESVCTALSTSQKSLAGVACDPAPDPEPTSPGEPSETEQNLQALRDLAERLAPYQRVTTQPFSAEDHDAAIAAAVALRHFSLTECYAVRLPSFADCAASVARNATDAEWAALIERAVRIEFLSVSADVLLAYRHVLDEAGQDDLRDVAADALERGLTSLPQLIENDDFWASTSAENAQRLVRIWASLSSDNDAPTLLGRLANSSQVGLYRTLDLLASTSQQTNQFTDDVSIVRQIRDPFGDLAKLIRPDTIHSAIAEFIPEAVGVSRWDVDDAEEHVRFASQFQECFPIEHPESPSS